MKMEMAETIFKVRGQRSRS